MNSITYKGKILLKDNIIDGFLSFRDGVITYVGTDCPTEDFTVIDNGIIAPGFIDIHCHSSLKNSAVDNPEEVALFHLSHGTTTLLVTFYRDISHEKLLDCLNETVKAMAKCKNLYGAHLEGPYLNANLGFGTGTNDAPDKTKYSEYIKSGIVRQWTCAPEIEGAPEFIKDITSHGIIPSIGHSCASYEQVKLAYENGARITTHIFDATSAPTPKFRGTLEVDFNEACMLMDNMFYEVICDLNWIHVRKEKLQLLIKTVGIDKIVAITDMCADDAPDDDLDVNIINGDISGSKLTLDKVATNLFNAGFSLFDIFKLTSYNPARALNLFDRGEIAVGKKADLILIDKNAKFVKLL